MKKVGKYLSLLIMILLVATGCGSKKTAKNKLEEAINNMRDIETVGMNMDATMGINLEGMNLTLTADFDVKVDKKHNIYAVMQLLMLGQSQKQEFYVIQDGQQQHTYNYDGDNWSYSVEPTITPQISKEDYDKAITEFYNAVKDVKEEKTDKKGYTKLLVTLDGAKANELSAAYSKETGNNEDITTNKDIIFAVYLKDGRIAIIEFDASDIINDVIGKTNIDLEADGISLKNMKFTTKLSMEFYDINKIDDIVVPQEVKNATLNKEQDITPEVEF